MGDPTEKPSRGISGGFWFYNFSTTELQLPQLREIIMNRAAIKLSKALPICLHFFYIHV